LTALFLKPESEWGLRVVTSCSRRSVAVGVVRPEVAMMLQELQEWLDRRAVAYDESTRDHLGQFLVASVFVARGSSWWDRLWGNDSKVAQQGLTHLRALEESFATYPDLRAAVVEGRNLAVEWAATMTMMKTRLNT
jgi:hypothetical protein